jgi:FTR1 family protein
VLPTFVIGLREGVEASLIVGIIAAFLRQQGRRDALRWMWAGVVLAVVLCTGVAVGLQLVNQDLPQRQQEGLETVVAGVAVAMVTFMIVWMRRNARGLAKELRANAAGALASGSVWGLVAMAFVSVVREGIETAVFLLAAFQASGSAVSAGAGAIIGILVACVIGWGIYRGGVKINLDRFFRLTALVLVLVAAGLVANAVHTAHEAAWLNSLQGRTVDLSWLVHPGSVSSSLLTGILGLQPQPTVGESVGWLVYLVPMVAFVLWPRRAQIRERAARAAMPAALGLLAVGLLAACGSTTTAPKGSKILNFALTDAGCAPATATAPTGPVTFEVKNGGSSAVTELELLDKSGIIVGEQENIVAGLSGSFTLRLDPGRYTLNCPNGDRTDNGTLTVTGSPTAAPRAADRLATAATTGYRTYVEAESAKLVAGTRRFVGALDRGDIARAKRLFGPVRFHYEDIEPVAESFGSLDPAIDARIDDVSSPAVWTGFHHIEQILWVGKTTDGTAPLAKKLLADVQTLDRRVRTLTFQPAQLANGAVELMNEVTNSKITGEEDRYSHTDLSDFAANVQGAHEAFDLLRPALRKAGQSTLVDTIEARFAAVARGLDVYRRSTPLGYAVYASLTPADRVSLAHDVGSLSESLAGVASHVAG